MENYKYINRIEEKQTRINNGENIEKVNNDINRRWLTGNEQLWNNYNIESLIDTDIKYNYNYSLYKRIKIYRYNIKMIKMIKNIHCC
jgi:hypothetical protein